MAVTTIQLATDGATHHLVLPDGVRMNLGEVSPLQVVATVCRDRRQARRILDEFNREGRVMLKADLELLAPLLVPRRSRFASPLMRGPDRTHKTRGMVMADNPEKAYKDAVAQQVANIERMIGVIEQKAKEAGKGSLSQAMMADDIANLKAMVKELGKAPTGQSANRAFYAADETASIASVALDKLASTVDTIDRLEAAGRPFNAARAREDVLAVSSGLRHVLGSMDVAHADAGTEIRRLAERADRIHSLFVNAK